MRARHSLFLPVLGLLLFVLPVRAAEDRLPPKKHEWSWEKINGHYERAALQRGLQVYKEVCSTCHTLDLVPFRVLSEKGGPGFSEAEVKALAAGYEKEDLDDSGQPKTVKRTTSDIFPHPFPNERAARAANGGALPPDLSVMVKAREDGANYIYSLQTGYTDPPPGVTLQPGMNYNPYFPNGQIAMPQPLHPDQVVYADGTKATVEQMAEDVVTFLAWAAEPKLEQRKRIGLNVMAYLVVLTGLLFFSYRRVWHGKH